MEPRRAVQPVAIDEGERGHVQPSSLGDESLRLLGALEKRKRGLRVELDEHYSAPIGGARRGPPEGWLRPRSFTRSVSRASPPESTITLSRSRIVIGIISRRCRPWSIGP